MDSRARRLQPILRLMRPSLAGRRSATRAIVGLLVAVLAGCASHRVWVRPDLTQQRFDQDNYACVQEVNAAGKGGWSFGPLWWVLWQQSAAKSGAKKLYE